MVSQSRWGRNLATVICTVAILPGNAFVGALSAAPQASPPAATASSIPADQLDSLVSPIALYPDHLLAQTLAASTYPLELLQLQQWLAKNPGLKDQALREAVAKQPWDSSIQAMAALPDVVKRLADDIQWTTDLGNAFLAQQSDVMDAVQRMRHKAQKAGNLKSSPQQTVEEQVVENKQVIVIEQADPAVVYVPSYNPTVVYGPAVYPYPPIYYPPLGYYAAGAAVSFGVGVAMGAFWSGGWGWGAGWGNNNITVNNLNNFNRASNIAGNRNVSNTWQHRAEHRGNTPYRDRGTADRFGGTARGESLANRQAGARQQVNRQGGNLRSNAVGTSGLSGGRTGAGMTDRSGLNTRASGAVGNRGTGQVGNRGPGDLGSRAGSNRSGIASGSGQRFSGSGGGMSSRGGSQGMRAGGNRPSAGSHGSFRSSGGGHRSGGGAHRGGGSRGGGSRGGGGRR